MTLTLKNIIFVDKTFFIVVVATCGLVSPRKKGQAHRGQRQGVHFFTRPTVIVHSNAPKAAFMNRRPELPTSLMSSLMPRLKNLAASPTCATAHTQRSLSDLRVSVCSSERLASAACESGRNAA